MGCTHLWAGNRPWLCLVLLALWIAPVGCGPKGGSDGPWESGVLSRYDALAELRAGHRPYGYLAAGYAPSPLRGEDWYSPERHGDGSRWVWMRGERARFSMRASEGMAADVAIELIGIEHLAANAGVELRLADRSLGKRPLGAEAGWLRFPVPEGLLQPDLNEFELVASHTAVPAEHDPTSQDQRALAVKVRQILLVPSGEDPEARARAIGAPGSTGASEAEPPDGALVLRPGELGQLWALGGPKAHAEWVLESAGAGPARVVLEVRDAANEALEQREERVLSGPGQAIRLDLAAAKPLRLTVLVPQGSPGAVRVLGADLIAARPATNLVLVVCDTLRADHFTGGIEGLSTPTFDRLRRESIVFERAYAHSPVTLPSHTSMFSSRLPAETTVTNNALPVPTQLPLLAEWLRWMGYTNRSVSSLGTLWAPVRHLGLGRGFHVYEPDWRMIQAEETNRRARPHWADLVDVQPFFLFMHYSDPHAPYNAHGEVDRRAVLSLNGETMGEVALADMSMERRVFELPPGTARFELQSESDFTVNRFEVLVGDLNLELSPIEGELFERQQRFAVETQVPGSDSPSGLTEVAVALWVFDDPPLDEIAWRYRREVEYFDTQLALLVETLEARGLWEQTLFVFTSDHGELLGERDGEVGHANFLDEGVVHVPLAIKLPKGHPMSERMAGAAPFLARHIDLAPTVLHLMGLPGLPGARGRSLFFPGDDLHLAEAHPPEARERLYVLTDGRHKLWYRPESETWQLFDLSNDPDEQNDLYPESGADFEAWRTRLLEHAAGAKDFDPANLDEAAREQLRALGYL